MEQLYCDYQYSGIMKEMIQQYKLMKDYYLAEVIVSQLNLPKTSYDLIVPIPSPIERDTQRTFNPVATVLEKWGFNIRTYWQLNCVPNSQNLGK